MTARQIENRVGEFQFLEAVQNLFGVLREEGAVVARPDEQRLEIATLKTMQIAGRADHAPVVPEFLLRDITGKLEIASVLSRVVDVLIELETGPTAPAVGPGAQRQHVTVLDAALRLALSSKRRPTIPSTRTVTVHVAAHPATRLGLAQPRPDRATPGHEETDMCTVNGRPLPAER